METHESIIESNLDKPIIIRRRVLKFEINEHPKELEVSNESDFIVISKIAHAYAKDYRADQEQGEIFWKLGHQIGNDFQFGDMSSGCDTLAGQIKDNRPEHRDCKLPTFLLAIAWKEVLKTNKTDIVFINSNLAHPYVHTEIDGENVFGHFTKPRRGDANPKSQFELLDKENTKRLKNFITQGKTTNFSIDLNGMTGIDEMFKQI